MNAINIEPVLLSQDEATQIMKCSRPVFKKDYVDTNLLRFERRHGKKLFLYSEVVALALKSFNENAKCQNKVASKDSTNKIVASGNLINLEATDAFKEALERKTGK